MFTLGDTFLAGEQVHGKHRLWIVINDPRHHGDTTLFVNVTSMSAIAEMTCVLQRGEHPFLAHQSWVRYASAKTALVRQLDALEASGLIIRQPPASAALLARIRAGAAVSPRLPQKFFALL